MLQTNCYLVSNEKSKTCIIVDPGDNAEFIAGCVENLGVVPAAIFLTHAHADHIQAVPELKEKYKVPLYVHEEDVKMLENVSLNLGRLAIKLDSGDVRLKGNEQLDIGEMRIKVIHTPGHTPGGVCYYFEDEGILLAGDTMFRCSWGRTDFPGGSEEALMDSIRTKLLVLPADTVVYPGHEGATTIENERRVHGVR